jgi:integrase
VNVPKRVVLPVSIDEVARFWSSFQTSRDLDIVGLMLLQGLRSCEVLALNRDDLILSEAQIRVLGKGNKLRLLPLAPETIELLDHYLRLERPTPCGSPLFVSLKGRARGCRMVAREMLFDTVFDPNETHNLATDPNYSKALAEMRGRLDSWMKRTNDPLLHGPVKAPAGAMVNDPDGISPKEKTRPA